MQQEPLSPCRRVVFAALSFLLCIALLEGAARAVFHLDPRFWFADDSASYRHLWTRGHRNGTFIYSFDQPDPVCGWTLQPNLRTMAFGRSLNSNSSGLRGTAEFSEVKPQGRVRILILGDSYAFGEEVSDDESYPSQLQRLLPNTEVINAGVHGYGQDQMLLRLQANGLRYHPDIVILGFLPMDMDRNVLTFYNYAKPRFLKVRDQMILTQVPVPAPLQFLKREPFRPKILDLLSILWHRTPVGRRARARETEEISHALLDMIRTTAQNAGAVPLFVYCPSLNELEGLNRSTLPLREEVFFDYCRSRQIPAFSISSRFLTEVRRGARLKTFGHWGTLEHRLAAEAIRDYLIEHCPQFGFKSPPLVLENPAVPLRSVRRIRRGSL